jgi:hypothetical protein
MSGPLQLRSLEFLHHDFLQPPAAGASLRLLHGLPHKKSRGHGLFFGNSPLQTGFPPERDPVLAAAKKPAKTGGQKTNQAGIWASDSANL